MEIVACLRDVLLGMQGIGLSDLLLQNKLSTEYSGCMDDSKGINNYADPIIKMSGKCKNDSVSWRSALDPHAIIRIIERHSADCSFKASVHYGEDIKRLDTGSLMSLITKNFTSDSHEKLVHLVDVDRSKLPIEAPVTLRTSVVPKTPQTGMRSTAKRSVIIPTSPCASSRTAESVAWITKRQHTEVENEMRESNFRTAGALLNQTIAVKQGTKYQTSSSGYGVSKRTLGGRRGPDIQFVPPIPSGTNSQSNIISRGPSQSDEQGPPLGDERLRAFDHKTIELIMSEVMDVKTATNWDDIAGLELQKKALQEVIILPLLRPDLFTGLRGPPKGLLLFGPPGTGKTLIGRCIASQSNSTFFCISASSLTSKWVGEGEKMVRALFAVARIYQPAVIFMDEVDSLLTQRSETEHESSRRIKTEFLVQLDGVTTGEEERLLFIGATNRPQELDEAARRRFVKRLYIPLPTRKAREQIVRHLFRKQHHLLNPEDFAFVADRTEGYSGADMANLCREAAMGPIRSLSLEAIQMIACDEVPPVGMADFRAALNQVKPSVSTSDLDCYVKWNKQYGSFDS
ncbi:unnamed protein product [Calicophoron daubneyi]|uniref:AAA+ ATPase domain-containing protein n=1 Tax=Calicophoron daubneyi TaxID=300641 RepID=A0AAV2T8H2_CALDB